MQTTRGLLNSIKLKMNLSSEEELANALRIPPTSVRLLYQQKLLVDESLAIRIARLLDVESMYVIALTQMERTSNDSIKREWLEIAKKHNREAKKVANS